MSNSSPQQPLGTVTKIFDPRDPSMASPRAELLDASVVRRGDQWWMYLAGQPNGFGPTDLFSASLPPGAPLGPTGWSPTRDEVTGQLVPLAGRTRSQAWDANGGRHCPSYARGWDSARGEWVERLYYAGAADHLWGPYTIGFLEWHDGQWIDQAAPAFAAEQDWEHGSVYEPNLIYHDGKWKMWYVAGANQDDYLVHGYAESEDGLSNWRERTIFAPPEMKMFDFCIRERTSGFDAIYSRVWLTAGVPPPACTGLWWCRSESPSNRLADWSEPVQLMNAEDRGWYSGPWKPSFQFTGQSPTQALVFFDGIYPTGDPGPFPFAFTLGCFDVQLPEQCVVKTSEENPHGH